MADNEYDLRNALFEIVEADSSTTTPRGLTVIMGTTHPMVRWGDRGMNTRPIITYLGPNAVPRRGAKDALLVDGQFDIWVESNSTGLEERIADRLEAIITQTNLASTKRTNPVDVAPTLRARRDLSTLAEEGARRLTIEIELRFNRS